MDKEIEFKAKLGEWGYKNKIEIEINYMIDSEGNIILDTDSMENNFDFCMKEIIEVAEAVNELAEKI